MSESPKHRPGDIILDHFVPHLDNADREIARNRLQEFARWLLHVAMDRARDEANDEDSPDFDSVDRLETTISSQP